MTQVDHLEHQTARSGARLIGLDLIRTWAFFAIVLWHTSWFARPLNVPAHADSGAPVFDAALFLSRYWSFSGITIVFLTSFLAGLASRPFGRKPWLPWFLGAGWIGFSAIISHREQSGFRLTWDVYPLLFVGLLTGWFIYRIRSNKALLFLLSICAAMLTLPFWRLAPTLPLSRIMIEILVGRCPVADWPIFPWLFLIWGGLASGRLYVDVRDNMDASFLELRRAEGVACIAAIATMVYVMPHWATVPVNDSFSCFTLRQPPRHFWGFFVGIIALVRLSLAPSIQEWLSRRRWANALSHMAFNRRFFLSYLVHYVAIGGMTTLGRKVEIMDASWYLDLTLTVAYASAILVPSTITRLRLGRQSVTVSDRV
ncbi:MAG: hypothetical protein AAF605_07490 [Myxococcota bacterium]